MKKTHEYIYNGALDETHAGWISSCLGRYPYAVEIKAEHGEVGDLQNMLTKHVYYQENDPGLEPERRETVLYSTCPRAENSDTRFYFFKTEEDKRIFVSNHIDLVVDYEPFKTKLMVKKQNSPIHSKRNVGVLYRVYELLFPKGST